MAVIKHGNIFQYVLLGRITCLVASPLHTLLLQGAEETLNHGIVPTIAFSAHAACDAMGFEQFPESLAGILRTSV